MGFVTSDGHGWSETRFALPPDAGLVGAEAFAQYLWPGTAPGDAASGAALHVTVQDPPGG